MEVYITLISLIIISIILFKLLSPVNSNSKYFDANFSLEYSVKYDIRGIYQVILIGHIIPISDDGQRLLSLYDKNLKIGFDNKTIKGVINNDSFKIEMIRKKDKNIAINLLKKSFISNVQGSLKEIQEEYKLENELKRISSKEKEMVKKIACSRCKNRLQCEISFTDCRFEEDDTNPVLRNKDLLK